MPFSSLTKELFEPDIHPDTARRHLRASEDVSSTYETARVYANSRPRPPKRLVYDRSLRGTGVLAWYLDPEEVKSVYPQQGMALEKQIGPEPIVAYNPDILKSRNAGFVKAVDNHEKAHGGQPGKMQLKRLRVATRYGILPLGEMLIEGGVEWALERRGRKPPSRYMDEMSSRTPTYSLYRSFVYELEEKQHGIMRQVYRAADRAGPGAAARLLAAVPGVDKLVDKYASKLVKRKAA